MKISRRGPREPDTCGCLETAAALSEGPGTPAVAQVALDTYHAAIADGESSARARWTKRGLVLVHCDHPTDQRLGIPHNA